MTSCLTHLPSVYPRPTLSAYMTCVLVLHNSQSHLVPVTTPLRESEGGGEEGMQSICNLSKYFNQYCVLIICWYTTACYFLHLSTMKYLYDILLFIHLVPGTAHCFLVRMGFRPENQPPHRELCVALQQYSIFSDFPILLPVNRLLPICTCQPKSLGEGGRDSLHLRAMHSAPCCFVLCFPFLCFPLVCSIIP